MLAIGAFVLGFTKTEMARALRFSLIGLIMAYGALMNLLSRAMASVMVAARAAQDRRAERKETAQLAASIALADQAAAEAVLAEAVVEDIVPEIVIPTSEPVPERTGLLSRMPSLIRRPEPELPEPELVEPELAPFADIGADAQPGDDRIRAKIADAVRARAQAAGMSVPEMDDPDRPLTKGRGRRPDPLVLDTSGAMSLPPEPPMTSAPFVEPQAVFQTPAPQSPAADVATVDPLVLRPATPVSPVIPGIIPTAEPRKVVQNPLRKSLTPSRRAKAEAQPALAFEEESTAFELPPLSLLSTATDIEHHHLSDEALEENARMLESVLDDYGVKGEIVSVRPGPVVTMYELEPAPGLKASRVIGLADDIARSMAALSTRISTVPGRSVIGIELPNVCREKVVLSEILGSRDFGDSNMSLPLALGKDIGGDPVVANLAKMPHLLIAGTTGSGKSVAINTMILSLLYKLTPDECRMIMIDPKMLELSVYDGIPHLLSPVVTDPKKAVVALKWTVGEMEDRYRKMSKMGVRNIEGYNGRVKEALAKNEMFSRTVQTGFDDDTGEPVFETEESTPEALPYIVVIVDEMADLMMVAGKEIEACIQQFVC